MIKVWLFGIVCVFVAFDAKAQTRRVVYIDPVSANAPTSWNNVSFITSNATAVLNDTLTNSTGIRITIATPLQGPNTAAAASPSGAAAEFAPAGANSAFGNTNVWSGKVIPFGQAVFSSLSTNTAYHFTFYGSRTGVSDNREALYTLTGATSGSNTLNASGNSSQVATVSNIVPRADGTIDLRLERGPNNNEPNGFFYITAMKVVYEDLMPPATNHVTTLYVDAAGTATAAGWNLVRMNLSSDVVLSDASGVSSGIRALVTAPFTNEGTHSTLAPVGAAAEFDPAGDNECYSASSAHVYAALSGMNPTNAYTFTFYAQRAGATGTRETLYTVTGVTSNSAVLDATDNTQHVAVVSDILPNPDGSMNLHISRGPNNSAGYIYLTAFKIACEGGGSALPPTNLPPVGVSAKRLLFFGNSFSQVDDVPGHVASLAEIAGHPRPLVVADLMGGMDLDYHIDQVTNYPANNVDSASLTGTNTWDHVIIQGYSTESTHINPEIQDFYNDAQTLYGLVKNHASGKGAGVAPVLYQTWARAPGHSFYPGTFPDPATMQLEIRTNYQAAADQILAAEPGLDLRIAKVGDAFERDAFNPADLYASDLYHAANLGTRLSAMVIFKTLYNCTVTNIPYAAAVAAGWTTMSSNDWTRVTYWAEGLTPPGGGSTPTNPPAAPAFGSREVFLIDTGNNDALSVPGWNSVAFNGLNSSQLVLTNGYETEVTCTVLTNLNSVNTNGSTAPTGDAAQFAPAGGNSAYGNTNTFGNGIFPKGVARFSGLAANRRYTFTFYASRTGVTDNREALYTVTGSNSGFNTLDAANNASQVATVANILPKADGTIDLTIGQGPRNTNTTGFFYITAIKIESVRGGTLVLLGP